MDVLIGLLVAVRYVVFMVLLIARPVIKLVSKFVIGLFSLGLILALIMGREAFPMSFWITGPILILVAALTSWFYDSALHALCPPDRRLYLSV